ncbi:unnamed protein product, partial [Effrenium voratum]
MEADDLQTLLGALSSLGGDPGDHLPMTCRTCGERCADRAESWIHTHHTGHQQFRSVLSELSDLSESSGRTKHCSHCRGLAARCGCRKGCPKPPGAECESRTLPSAHCEHCRGRRGRCGCDRCPRRPESECLQVPAPAEHHHTFRGNECGVCRECGKCTYRVTGRSQCVNDRGRVRPVDERPRICGCGSGPSVCSDCGVGPCCRHAQCRVAAGSKASPTQPKRAPVAFPGQGQVLGGAPRRSSNARSNTRNEDSDADLAAAIAQSMESSKATPPVPSLQRTSTDERESDDLQLAIALSLSESQTSLARVPPPPALAAPPAPPAAAVAAVKPSAPRLAATPAVPRPTLRAGAPCDIAFEYIRACTDHFSADRVLGFGSYGRVYHGTDTAAQPPIEFAAKRLECEEPERRQMLERMTEAEIKVLTAFAHPNIIELLGHCMHPDGAILVYEFLPEGSLDQHLSSQDKAVRLTWGRRSTIVVGLVAAVSYLHNHNPQGPCYHRDIKPGNIMLTASLSPKLSDCGLSRNLPTDRPGRARMTMQVTGAAIEGTPGFMCKRYIDTGNFNAKSEVYSIGVTILQLVTGVQDIDQHADIIDNADTAEIAEHCDTRPPCSGTDREAMQKLAAMAAAGIQRFAQRITVLPLLRQAREAAASAPAEEVSALRAELERMNAELRGLRLQEQAARAEMQQEEKPCELCFDAVPGGEPNNLMCPQEHLICAGCAGDMVRSFLERLGASDTMLEEHRDRGGTIPCVRHNPMFQPQCSAYYSEQALARALPGEVFVAYRASQNDAMENRIWNEHNQRFQAEVQRIQAEHEQAHRSQREVQESAEFLRRR